MIEFVSKGDFSKATSFLERLKEKIKMGKFDRYGRMGVEALKSATPVDSGETADSWYYKIVNKSGELRLEFCNSNVNEGVPIAVIIQYGHGTGTGGYVEGVDYINPAIQPVFDVIADSTWKEVISS